VPVVPEPQEKLVCQCANPWPVDFDGLVTCAHCGRRIMGQPIQAREIEDAEDSGVEWARHRGEDRFGDEVEQDLGVHPGALVVDDGKGHGRL
jgi:hypothetical protein